MADVRHRHRHGRHAGGHLLGGRFRPPLRRHRRLHRHARRLRLPPAGPLPPGREPARHRRADADVARALPAHLRISRPAGGHHRTREAGPAGQGPGRSALRRRRLQLRRERRQDPPGSRPDRSGGRQPRCRRPDRIGQVDPQLSRAASVRRDGRPGPARRGRRTRPELRHPCPRGGCRLAGDVSLPRLGRRQPALREAGRDGRGDRDGGQGGADPRPHRLTARRVRHAGRRARIPVLRWRETAPRDSPHHPARPAGPGARRGDERARHPYGTRGSAGHRRALRGPYDHHHRAQALHGAGRRPDRRPRRRANSRARHARGTDRPRRPVRGTRPQGRQAVDGAGGVRERAPARPDRPARFVRVSVPA